MPDRQRPRTWGRGRGSRLRLASYPAGHSVLITIRSHERKPVFRSVPLADEVFAAFVQHEYTDSVVLMPDHAHWLLNESADIVQIVQRFKSWSTHLAWSTGHQGPLWQRSFFDTLIRGERALNRQRRYILANPIRACLAETVDEYRWVHPSWQEG